MTPWAQAHKRPATIEIERVYWTQFLAFCRAKYLGDITPHTFASWHVMKGTEIALVSRWLGYSEVNVTMEHYAGLKPYHSAIESF